MINTPDTITRDSRVIIAKDFDTARNSGRDYRYTIRVGGKYDWNSYVLAHISSGISGRSTSHISGGLLGYRFDKWTPASKTKASIKTVGDVMDATGLKLAYNADGDLLYSTGSTRAFKLYSAKGQYHIKHYDLAYDDITLV